MPEIVLTAVLVCETLPSIALWVFENRISTRGEVRGPKVDRDRAKKLTPIRLEFVDEPSQGTIRSFSGFEGGVQRMGSWAYLAIVLVAA